MRNRLVVGSIAAVLLLVTAAIYLWNCTDAVIPPDRPFAPMQENPYWVENENRLLGQEGKPGLDIAKIPRGMFLRDGGDGVTLVKFANSEQRFKYKSGSQAIMATSSEEWSAGKDEVDCQKAQGQYGDDRGLEIDDKEAIVRKLGTTETIPTYAKFAANVYELPVSGRALVLSAGGPNRSSGPSLIFGLGGRQGGILGIRFAQIYDLKMGKYTRDAVALKSSAEFPLFGTCWAPDGRTAFVYELAIVSTLPFETNFQVVEP